MSILHPSCVLLAVENDRDPDEEEERLLVIMTPPLEVPK